jgi:hypothetical protein
MAKDKPGSSAGKSANLPQSALLAAKQTAGGIDKPANRPIETRSVYEPIPVVGIGASASADLGHDAQPRAGGATVAKGSERWNISTPPTNAFGGEACSAVMCDLARWKQLPSI